MKNSERRSQEPTKPLAASERRLRRQPEAVRGAAIEAARRLLLSQGPNAITLKSVAKELGMTHTNLIHHFGSASDLQSALMREMMSDLTKTLEDGVARFRESGGDVREFVDIVFDVFGKGGAGRLAAWMLVSGNAELFKPLRDVVRTYLEHIEQGSHVDPSRVTEMHRRFTDATLFVVITAFGDAIMGDVMHDLVGREREAVRTIVRDTLPRISWLVQEKNSTES